MAAVAVSVAEALEMEVAGAVAAERASAGLATVDAEVVVAWAVARARYSQVLVMVLSPRRPRWVGHREQIVVLVAQQLARAR